MNLAGDRDFESRGYGRDALSALGEADSMLRFITPRVATLFVLIVAGVSLVWASNYVLFPTLSVLEAGWLFVNVLGLVFGIAKSIDSYRWVRRVNLPSIWYMPEGGKPPTPEEQERILLGARDLYEAEVEGTILAGWGVVLGTFTALTAQAANYPSPAAYAFATFFFVLPLVVLRGSARRQKALDDVGRLRRRAQLMAETKLVVED